MTDYYGIDYGFGRTNIDTTTGIRYGVIPLNEMTEWAIEEFEPDYGSPTCPKCGADAVEYDSEKHDDFEACWRGACCDYACEECQVFGDGEHFFGEDPISWDLDKEGYKATYDDSGDVFLLASPYYTHAQYCSPCAPGACHLSNPTDNDGPRCYCFGHDWFPDNRAPYTVYRVSDDSIVESGSN